MISRIFSKCLEFISLNCLKFQFPGGKFAENRQLGMLVQGVMAVAHSAQWYLKESMLSFGQVLAGYRAIGA